jgi:hypothetical protein
MRRYNVNIQGIGSITIDSDTIDKAIEKAMKKAGLILKKITPSAKSFYPSNCVVTNLHTMKTYHYYIEFYCNVLGSTFAYHEVSIKNFGKTVVFGAEDSKEAVKKAINQTDFSLSSCKFKKDRNDPNYNCLVKHIFSNEYGKIKHREAHFDIQLRQDLSANPNCIIIKQAVREDIRRKLGEEIKQEYFAYHKICILKEPEFIKNCLDMINELAEQLRDLHFSLEEDDVDHIEDYIEDYTIRTITADEDAFNEMFDTDYFINHLEWEQYELFDCMLDELDNYYYIAHIGSICSKTDIDLPYTYQYKSNIKSDYIDYDLIESRLYPSEDDFYG